ncbi:regulatory protein RecX [Sporomusaceae bacterium FL31]|nr:regulatory protein RecX [Sporomusaceae bacterium FL31]GCE33528.1 regulatory protein RecX [Sporomusaceae bacterium]
MPLNNNEVLRTAIKILSLRMYSVHELRSKLVSKGYSSADVDHSIDELTRRGYLDDIALGELLFNKYHHACKYSIKQIIFKLSSRGLDSQTIDHVLTQYNSIDETNAALNLLRKRYLNPQSVEPAKIIRYLSSKGFPYHVINHVTILFDK